MLRFVLICLLCLTCFQCSVESENWNKAQNRPFPSENERPLVGIDLGSEFIKIALLRPLPHPVKGRVLDIVLNEQSRRKTPNLVGFRGNDLYLGEKARDLSTRFPQDMVPMLNRLIGRPYTVSDKNDMKAIDFFSRIMAFPHILSEDIVRRTIQIHLPSSTSLITKEETDSPLRPHAFSPELLLGFSFKYLYELTKNSLGNPAPRKLETRSGPIEMKNGNETQSLQRDKCSVMDAFLVVPYFFTSRQRQGLLDAALLGGFQIHGMVHTTTAIAYHYLMQHEEWTDQNMTYAIYDMGASRTEVGLYRFIPSGHGTDVDEKRGSLETLSLSADPTLGTRSFDYCLAKLIAQDFRRKTKVLIPFFNKKISSNLTMAEHKEISSLFHHANTLREVLSANLHGTVTLERLNGVPDFTTMITRKKFESECAPLFRRSRRVLEKALRLANLKPCDLVSLEVHGGGVRMPGVLKELQEVYGKPVSRTLNGDESACRGAAVYGLQQSAMFFPQGVRLRELFPHHTTMSYPKPRTLQKTSESIVQDLIYPAWRTYTPPHRKILTFSHHDDFEIIFRDNFTSSTLRLEGIRNEFTEKELNLSKEPFLSSHLIEVETKISETGQLEVPKAEFLFFRKEKASPNTTLFHSTDAEPTSSRGQSNDSTESQTENEDKDSEQKNASETDYSFPSTSSPPSPTNSKDNNTTDTEAQQEYRANLKLRWIHAPPLPMDASHRRQMQEFFQRQQEHEKNRTELSFAKNELQSLMFDIQKETVGHAKENATSNLDARNFSVWLEKLQMWLEMDDGGRSANSKDVFQNHTKQLRLAWEKLRKSGSTQDTKETSKMAKNIQKDVLPSSRPDPTFIFTEESNRTLFPKEDPLGRMEDERDAASQNEL